MHPIFVLLFTALATYRIFILVAQDKITENLREKFFAKFGEPTDSWTYLITCPWCLSMWVMPAMVLLYVLAPTVWLYTCYILAGSLIIGYLEDKR